MGSITVTRTMPANPTAVWKVLDDFANVDQWSSGVASANALNDIAKGVGAERMCAFDAKGKQWVKERVLERTDDLMVIDIFETNAPMKFLQGHITVKPAGQGSQVDFRMDMKVKGGPLGSLMEVTMVRPNFRKAVAKLLDDLDTASRAA